jgi:pyruvate dehydrogenase E2 component (dihydrolipoamide acetyltransferase)
MLTDVVLPNLGFGMEEGRLIAWLKTPGEPVKKGEAIAEIESDKASVELEATVDGVLAAALFPADTVIPVGAVLARIDTAPGGVAAPPAAAEAARDIQRITPVARRMMDAHGVDSSAVKGTGWGGRITQEDIKGALTRTGANGRPLAAPAVKRLARDNGIDLRHIAGSGPQGRVTRADVETALRTSPQSSTPVAPMVPVAAGEDRREVPFGKMRQVIATRLSESMQQAPHFYTSAELDFTPALRKLPDGIGINTLLLYLTIQTLRQFPAMNATFERGKLYHYDHVHLAIAVAMPDGLITPVLHNADDYSLTGLAARSRELISRARDGKLKNAELGGGTFTVSNLGIVQQVDRFTAIINPPQVAILAVGAAKDRPFVINGGLHVRTTAHLTLSADHRVVDGMLTAQFLEQFDQRLQAF